MANQLNLTIAPLGASSSNYTVRYRPLGSIIWLNSGVIPSNPISSSVLTSAITVTTDNTIYQVQVNDNCGSSIAQGAIQTIINRGCPSYLQLAISATDSTVTGVFPLNSPSPINNHVASIMVSLFIGTLLINTFNIPTPTAFNSWMFVGLTSNTIYSLVFDINYVQSDSIIYPYSLGDTANLHKCLSNSFSTTATAICVTPIITNITQS